MQVVSVDDVAETVAHCLRTDTASKLKWDVAHPQVLTLGAIVGAMRDGSAFRQRPIWRVPRAFGTAVSAFADVLGYLGWRSPARSTALRQLSAGVVGDRRHGSRRPASQPKSLEDILARQPSSVADRWFARLYLLKPLAIAGLALFWSLTGMITLGPGRAAAMAHLAAAGFPPALAGADRWSVGACSTIVLGLALLVRPSARLVLLTYAGRRRRSICWSAPCWRRSSGSIRSGRS